MTPRQIAALAVRVLALHCIIRSFDWLQGGLTMVYFVMSTGNAASKANPLWAYLPHFLPFFVYVGFGVIAWLFADGLAVFIAPREEMEATSPNVSTPDWMHIAFGALGAWFCVNALSALTRWGVNVLWGSGTNRVPSVAPQLADLVGSLVELAAGVWLLLGAKGLVKIALGTRCWLRPRMAR